MRDRERLACSSYAPLSIIESSFSVLGGTVSTTFLPMGFFEANQSVSGTAHLVGDIEYRGAGFTEASGTFFGYVDSTISPATNTTDITVAPPYTWRP